MTRVVLDPETIPRLNGLNEVIEICDQSGNVIRVTSPLRGGRSEWDVPLTDEDVAKLREQPRGRPLKEILADLEAGA